MELSQLLRLKCLFKKVSIRGKFGPGNGRGVHVEAQYLVPMLGRRRLSNRLGVLPMDPGRRC